ncbi:4-hydroxy-tetrahydrodipicolinate reductase [Chloroflexota bacterium]
MGQKIRVLIHGALGKMGQEVLGAVHRDPDLEAVAGIDITGEAKELLLPDSSSKIPFSTNLESIIEHCSPDVLVDFTKASATMNAVRIAAKHQISLVLGTTGLSATNLKEIEDLCHKANLGAVVAPNFALGAAVMIHLAKVAAKFFDYAEIIEMHHEEKLDAPSGTALSTAREMLNARGKPFTHVTAAMESLAGSRGSNFEGVALHSIRLPGLLAHQEVILGAAGQTLTIRHDTTSRACFMPGIILAIKRVIDLKEAAFGLDKVLEL